MPEEATLVVDDVAANPPPVETRTIVGPEEEVQAITQDLERDLLAPPVPSGQTTATPVATVGAVVEVDGEQVPVKDAVEAFKNMRAWRRENDERAKGFADLQRNLEATIGTLRSDLDQRIPRPPPPPPAAIPIPYVGPPPERPDLTTLEGQENYPVYEKLRDEWNEKRLQAAIGAVRDETLRVVDGRKAQETARTVGQQLEMFDRNTRNQFIAEDNLKAMGINAAQAQEIINFAATRIAPSGPVFGSERGYTIEDIRVAAGALGHRAAERKGREEGAKTVLSEIQRSQAASDVMRPGAAPAVAASGPKYSASDMMRDYAGFTARLEADVNNGLITHAQRIRVLEDATRVLTDRGLLQTPSDRGF